ncbi:metal ABC transporter solute-binding protein, Zn/Mn family [Cognatishimia activa]|uniref:Zinc ABC transporter substrate-binding protein n=1 Tax=Cognatishimia activa TaxID=1715691 RepID=A0A975ES26_9RHOB|nr:zinc ABC transporter substrate-binding protein [Cognatishimia activa]QTN37343.1 zinc ABC transporter substrate-binding protein [Cognatishimia activa]
MRFSRRVLLSFVMAVMAVPSVAMDRLNLVATTGMIADAARQVGGDLVDVKGLMGPGVDPHAYRQTRTDIVAMTRADLVLWHGLYLEAQMEDFFTDLSAKRNVVEVAAGLDTSLLRGHDDYEDKFDPHVWMNPDIWALIVEQVQGALTATQPESAEVFAANAQEHLAEIERLSGYAKSALASVPEQSRVLLSAHDAFGYFGEAYGFEVLGIQGISTESEAGLNRISELVDLLVTRDIRAVFVETSVSDRSMRAVIEGAAAKGHKVSIGGELFSDAMGEDGTYEGTYVGMIDHNATVITNALGGDAPLRGMNNKLSAGS